jgi:MSHA biogenesis protein MshM
MYLSHFGLNESPFAITPNPAFFFAGSKRGAILDALAYAITHGEGIVKVTGEVGSGKTMLCRMLESMLPPNIELIYLVNPTLGREAVLYAIAGELGLATGGKRADEVIRIMQQHLIGKHAEGKQVLLLIEEAQAMPLDTLEEIRLFSNLETAHHKLLQIVLFGQPELDANLALPRMRQLKERITHSFRVPPLPATVIAEFLMFRMRAAGYHGPDIFQTDAVRLMNQASEGIVRRISILADKSLLAAFADNRHTVDLRHVRAAIRDSEFSGPAAPALRRASVVGVALVLAAGFGWRTALAPVQDAHAATAAVAEPAQPDIAAGQELPARPARERPADPAQSLLRQRLEHSRSWLGGGKPHYFGVQISLMGADNPRQVERFLQTAQARTGADMLYVYPSRVGGTPYYGVVLGTFATRAQAQAKYAELSGQLGRPLQLRTLGGIRDEIRRSGSDDLWQQ